MAALCERAESTSKGEERWLSASPRSPTGCIRSTRRAPSSAGGRTQFATDDERTAYKVQDAFLKKLVAKQGPLVGYKIALTSPQIWEQTGLRGPAYGPIRKKRVFEHKACVRADRWTRLGVELEIILTVNADVPQPKAKPYDKDFDRALTSARRAPASS